MDRIISLEDEILQLRKTLQVKEKELQELKKKWIPVSGFSFYFCYCYCLFTVKGNIGGRPAWWRWPR